MSVWPLVEIGDVAEVVGGGTPSTKNAGYFDGDVPWLTPKDLSGSPARVVARGSRNLSRAGLANSSARLVPPGAVLLSTRAPIGYAAIAGGEISTNQGFRNLLPRGAVRSDFLYYWLKANTEVLERHAVGTTFRELPGSVLKRIRIPLPPLSEQRAVARVLGALDDKIEANRRMNATLEGMAQAAFKDWFVDFGPVRAKAEGRDTGLPDHIADLFPDKLVDSDLGEIPEGWNRKPVSDFASIKGGKQLPKDKFAGDGTVPVFGGAGLMGYTSDYNAEGFIISVGRVGAYCGQFFAYSGPAWINNNASLITCKKGVSGEWTYLSLRNLDIDLIKKGAAQPFVSNSDIAAMEIISPSTYILEKFRMFSEPLFLQSDQTKSETKILIDLRNTLLPKLVSGEIRLGEAVERLESDS